MYSLNQKQNPGKIQADLYLSPILPASSVFCWFLCPLAFRRNTIFHYMYGQTAVTPPKCGAFLELVQTLDAP